MGGGCEGVVNSDPFSDNAVLHRSCDTTVLYGFRRARGDMTDDYCGAGSSLLNVCVLVSPVLSVHVPTTEVPKKSVF